MKKSSRWFSKPLMKQNIKSNRALTIVIVIVMILMSTVINYAMSIMSKGSSVVTAQVEMAQEDFYSYLFAMSTINSATGASLSYEDFDDATDKTMYENAFQMVSMQAEQTFTVEEFEDIIETLKSADVAIESLIEQFEYVYALQQTKGVFTGNDLTMEGMMSVVLEAKGVKSDLLENMGKMDTGSIYDSCAITHDWNSMYLKNYKQLCVI